jgi:hypothetical protein
MATPTPTADPAENELTDVQKKIMKRALSQDHNRGVRIHGLGNWAGFNGPNGFMHPIASDQASQAKDMAEKTMSVWGAEHSNRVLQAREQQQRNHEANLQAMKTQAEMAKQNAAMQMSKHSLDSKNQRNAALLSAAGLGSTTVSGGGQNGFQFFRNGLLQ